MLFLRKSVDPLMKVVKKIIGDDSLDRYHLSIMIAWIDTIYPCRFLILIRTKLIMELTWLLLHYSPEACDWTFLQCLVMLRIKKAVYGDEVNNKNSHFHQKQ